MEDRSAIDDRKAAILRAVIEEYVETGQPVGSGTVARAGDLNISSATVRNEMSILEREGYVTHPHTSAGRIPTDKGYRFFVDHLARTRELLPGPRQELSQFFATAHHALEDILRETSVLLSRITDHAAVVIGPQVDTSRVRSVQVVHLQRHQLLVVAVLSNGSIEREFLEVAEDPDETVVRAATAALDSQLGGVSFSELPALRSAGDAAVDAIATAARNAFADRSRRGPGEPVFVGGASRIAAEPDAFAARQTVARLLELLEHQFVVVSLVRDLIEEGVTVRIGSENRLEDLRECSVVLARYDMGEGTGGTLAVLGPTRMDYPQTMAAVAAVSRRLNRHFTSTDTGH